MKRNYKLLAVFILIPIVLGGIVGLLTVKGSYNTGVDISGCLDCFIYTYGYFFLYGLYGYWLYT